MFARLSAKHTFCCILLFKMNFLIQTMAFAQTSQRMWSEIQSPTSENILYAQLLHENLGYIFAEKQQLQAAALPEQAIARFRGRNNARTPP